MNESGPADPSREAIADYIRSHRDRFTREALDDYLIRQGHAKTDVEAAWSTIEAESEWARFAAPQGTDRPRLRQSILASIAVLLALAAFVAGMFGIFVGSNGRPLMILYAVLFPLQIILVTRWIYRRIRGSRALRGGDAAATIGWLIVPPVALIAILGVCVAYSSSFGCFLHC
jgi:hypothetical protein